jgi:hypothetical protein
MKLLKFEEYSIDFNKVNELNSFSPFDKNNTYNHVCVYGVLDGKITDDGSGVMTFDNIANAQETFEELDPVAGSKNFTHAYDLHGMTGVLSFATHKKLAQRNYYA